MPTRTPQWYDKWINPSSMIALFGGVVWGVQLNFAVLANSDNIGQLRGRTQKVEITDQKQNTQLARISVILENIEWRMNRLEDKR